MDAYVARYDNRNTRRSHRDSLGALFLASGRRSPADLTEADFVAWATIRPDGKPYANNTTRQRTSNLRTFLRWCIRNGHLDPHAIERIIPDDQPATKVPRIYGKQQHLNPARFLDRDQADALIAACHDDTNVATRDEVVIRLGLSGIRSEEIRNLLWRNLTPDGTLHWIGKKRRPRSITVSKALAAALSDWRQQVTDIIGHEPTPDMPLVCPTAGGFGEHTLRPHIRMGNQAVWRIVTRRAQLAGLGHVAAHDLRRSTANILHRATTPDGAHHFDLLDIQKVLGHADPATTMRCYLDPLDNSARDRAADFIG